MFKISTKLGLVSALDMWYAFVKVQLAGNPNLDVKRWKHITDGELFYKDTQLIFINYPAYKTILKHINTKIGNKLIEGYAFDLGNGLGDIFVTRVERPANGKRINKAASFKLHAQLKEKGTLTADNWKVPYTDDDFIMVMWHKGNGRLRNIHLYKFKTAGGQPGKGFRAKLSRNVRNRPSLKSVYPYLPSKSLIPQENAVGNNYKDIRTT